MNLEEWQRFNLYSNLMFYFGTKILTDREKADYHELMKQWLVGEGLATPEEMKELVGYYA